MRIRAITLATGLALTVTSMGLGVVPVAAQSDAVIGTTAESAERLLPDPETFDLATTTFFEIQALREQFDAELVLARVFENDAEGGVADARALHAVAEADVDAAVQRLAYLRSTLTGAAIDSFVIDNSTGVGSPFGTTLEQITDRSLTIYTTDELVSDILEAQSVLAEAETAMESSAAALEAARAEEQVAIEARRAIESDRDDFEERASDHERTDEQADRQAARISPEVELQSVAGSMIVNAEIEDSIDALVGSARMDGIDLGGGSFRTVEAQIALRLAHCGGSVPPDAVVPGPEATPEERAAYDAEAAAWRQYVIYEKPASSCSPPTASAGNSQHQLALAIDFTENGTILNSQSPGFAWLVEHGEEFGMINLPSEAWHWSTTGR